MKYRSVAAVGACGLGVVVLAGCGWPAQASFKGSKNVAVAVTTPTGLDVETENGAVSVTPSTTGEMKIVATIRATSQARLDQVTVTSETGEDGVVRVRVSWPGGKREMNEGCGLAVEMPAVRSVHCTSSNGALTLTGMSGAADLRTSNGAIKVTGHAGVVKAKTSNGSVTLEGVEGAAVESSNGALVVRLSPESKGPVTAKTSNGSVTLAVGAKFAGSVTCKTSNGTVRDTSGRGAAVGAATKTHAVFGFGEGDGSTLDTSNGSVTIEKMQ